MNKVIQRSLRIHSFAFSSQLAPNDTNSLFALQIPKPTSIIFCKYASSSSPSPSPPRPSPPSTRTTIPTKSLTKIAVNGPLTTLPPPLTIPAQKPDQSYFPSYVFTIGKAYLTFYKTGIKAIWQNYKAARPIQASLDAKHHGSLAAAVEAGHLTRTEFQLLLRNFHDLKRVPVFALILFVCGELTPLVVIAVSGVVPYTCRIPKQIESDRKQLESSRAKSFRDLTKEFVPSGEGVLGLDKDQLLHISRSLGLSSRLWDWIGGPPTPLLRRRLKKRVEYLDMDDALIRRNGGVDNMSIEEVMLALEERGLDVIGRNESQQRSSLKAWLRARDRVSQEKLLLTRPSVWPVS